MKILVNEKISQHKYKTPEGYLICVDSVLARTGNQTYRKNELFVDSEDDSEIEVGRSPEEVFSPETLASFENKPITVEHPDEDVNIENYKDYSVGFVRDVKQGKFDGQDVILGTLVITDKDAIEGIENGEHVELSCGYDCDIEDGADGYQQKHIRGNHVALCEAGRAGIAKIIDSVNDAVLPEAKGQYKGYEVIARHVEYKNAPTEVDIFDGKRKVKSYFTSEEDLTGAIREVYKFWPEPPLTKENRKYIGNYLSMISGFVRRKDTDIQDVLRPLNGKGFKPVVEKIEGWIWKKGEYAYKNYYISLDGYKDTFLVTLYADPNQDWDTKEVNAYFTDSVKDEDDKEKNFEIEYLDNNDAKCTQTVPAKTAKEAERKLKEVLPVYQILSVKPTKDSTPDEEQTTMLEKDLEHFEDAKDSWAEEVVKMLPKNPSLNDIGKAVKAFLDNLNKKYPEAKSSNPKKEYNDLYDDVMYLLHHKNDPINDVDPRSGESKDDFIARFMKETKNEYPDEKQRLAVAYSYWERKGRDSMSTDSRINDLYLNGKVSNSDLQNLVDKLTKKYLKSPLAGEYGSINIKTGDPVLLQVQITFYMYAERTWRPSKGKDLSELNSFKWTVTIYGKGSYNKAGMYPNRDKEWESTSMKEAVSQIPEVAKYANELYDGIVKGKKDSLGDSRLKDDKASNFKRDVVNWWKEVERWNNESQMFKIENDYRDIEGLFIAIPDIIWDRQFEKAQPALAKVGERLYKRWKYDYHLLADSMTEDSKAKDSMKDAKQTFEIRWIDQYQKSKGYDKSFWLNVDTIKADTATEALEKLKNIAVMRGTGTRYITIVNIKSNTSNYQLSGNVDDVIRRLNDSLTKDSKIKDWEIEAGKTYTAKSGAKIKVKKVSTDISEYNGEANVRLWYDWVSASGKKSGTSNCSGHDFFEMMTNKNLTGDSMTKDSIYAISVQGQKSKKLVRAKDAREAIDKYNKIFPKDKIKSVKKTDKFNNIIETITR